MTEKLSLIDEILSIEWRPIILHGINTGYEVTNSGAVKSSRGRIMSPAKLPNGDLQVTLRFNGVVYTRKVHNLVASAFLPNPENRSVVIHINGNRSDNRVENLKWGSPIKGKKIHRKYTSRLYPIGEDAPNTRHSVEKIYEVCRLLEEGKLNNSEISRKMRISLRSIHDIKTKRYWRHVSDQFKIPRYRDTLRGNDIHTSRYSEETIREVCKMIKKGKGNKEIGSLVKINPDMVSKIRKGLCWKHISSQYQIV